MTVAYKYMDVAKLFLVNVLNMETYSTTSCIHTNSNQNLKISKISVTSSEASLGPAEAAETGSCDWGGGGGLSFFFSS